MADDMRAAQRQIDVLIRSLGQIKGSQDFWDEFLQRSGEAIVSGAKLRAPVDRGALRRAIGFRVKKSGIGLEVGVLGGEHKGVPYARIVELGGVIKPHKARWLAIPLSPQYENRSPRSYDLGFVTLGGKRFMVDRVTGRVAYSLKKSVTFKKQPYLRPAIEEYRDRKFKILLNKVFDKFMGGL